MVFKIVCLCPIREYLDFDEGPIKARKRPCIVEGRDLEMRNRSCLQPGALLLHHGSGDLTAL